MDDWRKRQRADQCLQHCLLKEELSDIRFTFKTDNGEEKSLPAHRFVLGMRSPVFQAMFYGPMKEIRDTVLLEDEDIQGFEELLRYLYTDKALLTEDNVLHCLYSAKKYCMDGLTELCEDHLKKHLSADNVSTVYEVIRQYDMDELQRTCLKYICNRASTALHAKDFSSLSRESLCQILSSEELDEEELEIFKAVLAWAKEQCRKASIDVSAENMRESLGQALYLIRLPLIPLAEFTEIVEESGVLTLEEQVEIYRYGTRKSKESQTSLNSPGKFSDKPRDGCKSFSLKLTVDAAEIKTMDQFIMSEPLLRRKMLWKLKVRKQGDVSPYTVGLYLECKPTSDVSKWTCHASFDLIVVNQVNTNDNVVRSTEHNFTEMENDWGFKQMAAWKQVMDKKSGYLLNDKLKFIVRCSPGYPDFNGESS